MIPDDEDVSEEPPMDCDEEMDEADNEQDDVIDQDEDEDIDQQIVNITNKNAHHDQAQNNEAILVINNQNDKDLRPMTKQVKTRQAATSQGQRPAPNSN